MKSGVSLVFGRCMKYGCSNRYDASVYRRRLQGRGYGVAVTRCVFWDVSFRQWTLHVNDVRMGESLVLLCTNALLAAAPATASLVGQFFCFMFAALHALAWPLP